MFAYPLPRAARTWPWPTFVGDRLALKFASRELVNLHRILKHVTDRRTVVQAGGNIGIFPKYLAGYFESVLTFEPDADNFAALKQNAPEANIGAFPYALGERQSAVGLARVRRDGSDGAEHAGLVHVSGTGDVPMIRLDECCLTKCGLIMLDIEGYELPALQGAIRTITRCRPAIAIEVNQNCRFFGISPDDIAAFFRDLSYRYIATFGKNDRLYLPC